MKNYLIHLFVLIATLYCNIPNTRVLAKPAMLLSNSLEFQVDTTSLEKVAGDTVSPVDTLKIDSVPPSTRMESSFKSKVKYDAEDSIMIDNVSHKAYLWGNATVKYEGIELNADYLEIDFEKNEVLAKGLPDSTGTIQNTPVFKEKGQEYVSAEMLYNFESKKGIIKKITTQEASGYIHGDRVKMASQDVFYIRNGRYTTCELDHPHYYIQAKKLKIINNDKIVTGPAYMAIEDVPTFLAVPFGFFPNQDTRASGVIVPTLGSSDTKGFNLVNGGYYFGFSDQIDLKITGDIYTNGTWAVRAATRYNQRYKRNGNFQFNYTNSKTGEKYTPDFTQNKSYFLTWNHRQDPKARPNSDFSALIRFGSQNYFQNDIATPDADYIRNEFNSNITYSQNFSNTPFTFKMNASHNQNNKTNLVNVTLPEATLTMSRIYPFKRRVKIGRDKWYEKIGVNYSGNFKNQFELLSSNPNTEGQLEGDTYASNFRNGVKNNVTTSTSFKIGQFNLSPGINYTDIMYFKTYQKRFDAANDTILTDTLNTFNRFGDLSLNASLSTRVYGIFQFRGSHLKAIRHTATPTVSFNYRPNLTDFHPEYFYTVSDTSGNSNRYSIFDGSIYGGPNGIDYGNLSFQLQNIVEMKHKGRNDTTDTFKNTTLIDAWNFGTSYNMLADSFNWSPLRMDIRTKIGKYVNWVTNTTSSFYGLQTNSETGKVTQSKIFNYNQSGQLLRLTQVRTSVGLTLSGDSKTDKKRQSEIREINPETNVNGIYEEDRYIDFNVPWNLNVKYVLTYNKPLNEVDIINSLSFSGSINLTPGWKFQMMSSYDFEQQKLGFTTMNIYRDLHCWQIDLRVTPFGTRKSFSINIKVKQGFLQDLKLSKNSRWFDG